MSRRMKLASVEMGDIEVLTILGNTDGTWEPPWDLLRPSLVGDLVSVVAKESLDHILWGLSRPFVVSLGIPPEGALRKLPKSYYSCCYEKRCPFRNDRCSPKAKGMPWCFEPNEEDEKLRSVVAQTIALWHEGAYLVVIHDR